MKVLDLLLLFPVLLTSLLLSGCNDDWFSSSIETLYSYRQVGQCGDFYVGEEHTPTTKIKECVALITTKLSVNISQSTQTVTLIEEDLGINKEPEFRLLSATKLSHCSIVDKSNFRCDGLERKDGKFVDTGSIGWRRISDSRACAIKAQYLGDGWVDDSTLTYHDSAWIVLAYAVGAVVLFGIFFVGLQ